MSAPASRFPEDYTVDDVSTLMGLVARLGGDPNDMRELLSQDPEDIYMRAGKHLIHLDVEEGEVMISLDTVTLPVDTLGKLLNSDFMLYRPPAGRPRPS